MGCDIHMHIEMQTPDGRWLHYAAPSMARKYELFAKMAGVRNHEPGSDDYIVSVSQPKGLPNDCSEVSLVDWNRGVGYWHSASWLSMKEWAQVEEWIRGLPWYNWMEADTEYGLFRGTYAFGNTFTGPARYKDSPYPDGCVDFRFVFWFDN